MVKLPVYAKSKKLPEGTILVGHMKTQWILGKAIGQGGFGCIYSAREEQCEHFNKVIKIEPQANGPLFTEINFYKRAAKESDIISWMKKKKLKFFGMPRYISSGIDGENRFLVMDRCGDDLHKTLTHTSLTTKCILQISINIIDILEYIHSMDYAHADIKAMNIMRGFTNKAEVYLLDFGMVSKFQNDGVHRPEKIDPKCKNNGTVEFSARDSHAGLMPSRRGDIESLFFNMVFWLTWSEDNVDTARSIGLGRLPWMSILRGVNCEKVPLEAINKVAQSKIDHVSNPKKFMKIVGLDTQSWCKNLEAMLTTINQYSYSECPDYDELRQGIASIISAIDGKPLNVNGNRSIDWDSAPSVKKSERRSGRKRSTNELEGAGKETSAKKIKAANSSNNNNIFSELENINKPRGRNVVLDSDDDTPIASLAKKRTVSKAKPKTLKERNSTGDGVAEKVLPKAVKIPGQKQLEQLIAKKAVKKTVKDSPKSGLPANTIIPGLKDLKRYQKGVRSSPRIQKAVTNSVSCQTSPKTPK